MNDVEFGDHATAIARSIPELPEAERIAAACRGSANPIVLAWLAECLRVSAATSVIDLGSGLGGPAAWLTIRYGCAVVNLDPALPTVAAGVGLFGTPAVCGTAENLPVRQDAFDVALLLGVISVVDDPDRVLSEALRVARQLGVMDYCSASPDALEVGGSKFPTREGLREAITKAGWTIDQLAPVAVPAPHAWTHAIDEIDVERPASELEVVAAIADGLLAPVMFQATR